MRLSLSSGDDMAGSIKGCQAAASKLVTKKRLLGTLRVLVSVALLGYLLATTDLGDLLGLLRSWNGMYFVVAVLLGALRNVIFAYRWKVALSVMGIDVPLGTLIKFYFVGTFFNLFLPTALGGDVVRGHDLAVYSGKRVGAATSVLMERIVGFLALAFIALVALLLGSRVIQDPQVTRIILFVCLGYVVLVIVVFNARIMKRLTAMLRFIKWFDIGRRLDRVCDSLHAFTTYKGVLCQCLVLSLICQTLAILAAYSLALAINLQLAPIYFFMVLPIIWVVTMIPVSINGLGLREGAFVFFFTKVGVSDSSALLLSFLNFSQTIVLGVTGGTIYLLGQVFPVLTTWQKVER